MLRQQNRGAAPQAVAALMPVWRRLQALPAQQGHLHSQLRKQDVLDTSRVMACRVEGCERDVEARGLCRLHYQRLRKTGDVGPSGKMRQARKAPCSVEGCKRQVQARGLCQLHYVRKRKTGDVGPVGPTVVKGIRHEEQYAEAYAEFWAKRVEFIENAIAMEWNEDLRDDLASQPLVGHRLGGPPSPVGEPELWGEFYRAIATDHGTRKMWARSQEEYDWERANERRVVNEEKLRRDLEILDLKAARRRIRNEEAIRRAYVLHKAWRERRFAKMMGRDA